MTELIKVQEEIIKLGHDPQYIDYFKKMVKNNWHIQSYKELLDEAITYYKDKEEQSIYNICILLRQKNEMIYGHLNQAIEMGENWLENLEIEKDLSISIEGYNQQFSAYMYKGEFKKAITYSLKAFDLLERGDFCQLHITLLLNIANLYIFLGEFKRTKEVLAHLESMSFLFKDRQMLLMALAKTIVRIYEENVMEAYKTCQEAYEYAIKINRSTEENIYLSFILVIRGYLLMRRHLKVQAEKDFKQALSLSQEKGYKGAWLFSLIGYSYYYLKNEQYEEAEKQLEQAEILEKEVNSAYLLNMIWQIKYQVYEKIGEWERAFKAMELTKQYYYGLYLDKTNFWMTQLESKHINMQLERYKKMYFQMQQVAKIGASFTSQLSEKHLQQVLFSEIVKLLDLDFLGVLHLVQGEMKYKVFDVQGKNLEESNDIVKYTERIAQHCMEIQKDLLINDGDFKDYTMKTIRESASQVRLQSLIVNVLKVEDKIIGALVLGSYTAGCYSQNDMSSAKIIASYLAISLKNSSLYQEVCYLANHDSLTGLLCRGIVLKEGETLFKLNHKHGKTTAIIMFDIDNFKQINDKYGHQIGDSVLKKVGEIMRANIRKCDYVGRYGGEEFIAILDNISYEQVISVANRIKEQLASCPFETKKEKIIEVTLSGGIYVCDEYTLNFADAIRFADHALYRAKLLGRNRIINYTLAT